MDNYWFFAFPMVTVQNRRKDMGKNKNQVCLLLHKKSCTRPEVKQAIRYVREKGVDLSVRISWGRKDQKFFIKQAIKSGVTRFIAGGGDGTINGVVNVLMRQKNISKLSLGIMPLGTANDFARGAGLPMDDITSSLLHAAAGEATPIDIGRANKDYFINVASGGFGAEVTATTPQDLKKALGGAAYTLMGLVKALNLEPYSGKIILPNGTIFEGSMMNMAVANNRFAGGAFEVAPRASLTDGLLDLVILSSANITDLQAIAAEIADPLNRNNKFLRYQQLKSFVPQNV